MSKIEVHPELRGGLLIVFRKHVELDGYNIGHLDGAACLRDLREAGWQSHLNGVPDDEVDEEVASAWFESAEPDYDEDGGAIWIAYPYEVLSRLAQRGITFVRSS